MAFMRGPDTSPIAPIGLVEVACPDCETRIPIEVFADAGGRSDDGVLQVSVVGDMIEVKAHSLTCTGALT